MLTSQSAWHPLSVATSTRVSLRDDESVAETMFTNHYNSAPIFYLRMSLKLLKIDWNFKVSTDNPMIFATFCSDYIHKL